MDTPTLKQLLQRNDVWRACDNNDKQADTLDSGHPVLNRLLPGQGWPHQGLTEFLCARQGMGELSLLAPALRQLSQQGRWIALLNPPFIPYAPAWAACGVDLSQILVIHTDKEPDRLWALETLLASNTTSAALYWPARIHAKALRRLQVASKKGRCWGILFRPSEAAKDASPATLRIQLSAAASSTEHASPHGVLLKVLKRPGGWTSQTHFIETPRPLLHTPLHTPIQKQQSNAIVTPDTSKHLPKPIDSGHSLAKSRPAKNVFPKNTPAKPGPAPQPQAQFSSDHS
ncbi:MAG: hypothetical protein COB04_05065 [Gammaproteobacteria bacterium]|nr:MAG: hypothetical protein COB04_05065 [Gammaproteobacteria bacterium]